ncbi:structural maintenance of chromosomes flexible hinge domain-containing protein GMI1 [Triticum dicoccoides]|uniref:structural maintenance of chromosomes flexible hinge domain-containing protein GMI1 n=1 Tax=Triticum dicoccoides TaxID=85692 RepID=UPI000E7886AF|nr:structural maintenance of chromosomes flexible hinge domain-containing protein GMI1 [Triticum dicoccoides]
MASSASEKWAVVQYGHHGPATKVYQFQILLPNGTSTSLKLRDPGEEMPLPDFLHRIREESGDASSHCGQRRGIEWDGDVYLEDLLDRKIDKKVQFSDFVTKGTNILRLQDGEEFVRTYENMWDLTPPTELLQELPAEYSTESALADLVDNSLQALWSNGSKEIKLIRITVDGEKIVVFDTGRGMDGSEDNSISKWGTMGSSNHRVFRKQGIGGKAPYLVPFFGMFGYGGTIASMHLGRTAIVSSKTKESRKVFTLHLSREALLEKSSSKLSWKTAGGVRDPSEEELALSPHRSFTQVEIHGLNRHLEPAKLRGFLKDIYFPYIQYDEDNGSASTRRPVQFEVNGVDLAEIQESEVTLTNLHSSNGPDFDLHLKFACTSTNAASRQAHARIKCVYFPIVKGKESIDSILEKLSENALGVKENFDNFSRVSVRRLGRLLPDARWVLDHCGNHVEEGTELIVNTVGFSFVDKCGPVRKVNSKGFVDLRGMLKVVSGFGSEACLTIFHHKKKIFNRTFQIAIRNLKAVKVPESCPAGTFLENIIFEVSDCDGVIDESIHGLQHTLSIRSNQLKDVQGAQYAFEHGRCVLPRAQVPNEPGTVSFVAYHTHFADLETIIQIHVYALDLVRVNSENDFEPICSYPTSSLSSQDLLSPSQLASCQSVRYIEDALRKVSDEIESIDSNIRSEEEMIKFLDSQKKSVENRIASLKDEIGHRVGAKEITRHKIEENVGTAAAVLCNLSNRKAYAPERSFKDEVVGIVALLGTVANRELSRMLSVYLGEDNMLAVVCKTQDAANYFEKYDTEGNVDIRFGIHQEAAKLGVPISRRFPIICLDEIRPYNGDVFWNIRQKKLNLPFPHSETPKGFRGFAVNLINLSAENLEIITSSGHGLRETLFYRLFGELQVYETRNDMRQAMPHLRNGAISLDGGIIKGDGMLLLGYSDPEIIFPVMPDAPDILEDPEDVFTKVKKMNAEKNVLETVENKIRRAEENRQKLVMKRNKKKRKFDEMAEVMSQPSGSQLDQYHPVS